MPTIINKLFPYRSYNETDVVSLFAHSNTGQAGELVSIVNFAPDSGDGYTNIAPGNTYPNVYSVRYATTARVTPSASGDTKYAALGITLKDTREYDENGEKLIFHPQLIEKLNCIVSGQTVPVLTRGILQLASAAYVGIPLPGYVGVIDNGGNGIIRALAPTQVTGAATGYATNQIVGKFISSSGSKLGGSAFFKLEL